MTESEGRLAQALVRRYDFRFSGTMSGGQVEGIVGADENGWDQRVAKVHDLIEAAADGGIA